jgi:Xaa-Pro dipeptidase
VKGVKTLEDFVRKLGNIRNLIKKRNLDGILITKQNNFSWLTGGKSFVNIASDLSVCKLLITPEDIYVITNNVDAPLILEEEINKLNVSTKIFQWYELEKEKRYIEGLLTNGVYGTDFETDKAECISDDLYTLRTVLTDQEINEYKLLGQDCATSLEEICESTKVGETELEIAGKIAGKLYPKDIIPVILLVATDERAYKYRHPLPTSKSLNEHAVLSICGRRKGLIAAVTRIIHFGTPPKELKDKHDTVVKIDANFIYNTRPGKRVKDIFKNAIDSYKEAGYEDAWESHFQGGLTSYNTREHKASLYSKEIVKENQAYAWNPSISGTKSEDTFLVMNEGNEMITETGNFPYSEIKRGNMIIKRPDILIR